MRRLIAICCLLILLSVVAISLNLTAQEHPVAPTDAPTATPTLPRALTPGEPISATDPTVAPNACYEPLSIDIGQVIYIKPGVNIRNEPTQSSAIVWNTIYDNYVTPTATQEPDELPIVRNPPLSWPVTVQDGPVCNQGYNWWYVAGREEPGWVAEGRPDEPGYYLIVPGAAPAPCQPRYNLEVGDTAELVLNARVRAQPDPTALVRTIAQAGNPVEIIGGPECVGDFLWWQVRVSVAGATYTGWMAEGSDDAVLTYYLLPSDLPSAEDGTLCARPLPFVVGQRGQMEFRGTDAKALRAAPGTDEPLLFSLVDGVPFVIAGGPVCADNLNWWKIQILASRPVLGWVAEGSPGVGYWIDVLNPDEYRGAAPPPGGTPTPPDERRFPEPDLADDSN
jgi:hypothetical protein